jgi:GNAT superfamily N-acetyltransferase
MPKCIRTNSEDPDFRKLVEELDAELRIRDGDEHSFYAQYNKIDMIRHVILAYEDSTPVGCGAIKEYSNNTMEVKRMYVPPGKRGDGIATLILKELEAWALELNFTKCILETGEKQPEAVRLYEKNDYKRIPNFGQYENIENSICFEKKLRDSR